MNAYSSVGVTDVPGSRTIIQFTEQVVETAMVMFLNRNTVGNFTDEKVNSPLRKTT